MTVHFRCGHNVCVHCGLESPLYQPWPRCRDCQDETCPACEARDSRQETDGVTTVQCTRCHEQDEAELSAEYWGRTAAFYATVEKDEDAAYNCAVFAGTAARIAGV